MNKIDTIEELLYEQEKLDQALNSLEAELKESDLGRRLAKLQSDRDLVKNKVNDAIKFEADKMLDHKPYMLVAQLILRLARIKLRQLYLKKLTGIRWSLRVFMSVFVKAASRQLILFKN